MIQFCHEDVEVCRRCRITDGAIALTDQETGIAQALHRLRYDEVTGTQFLYYFPSRPYAIRLIKNKQQQLKRPNGVQTAFDHLPEA